MSDREFYKQLLTLDPKTRLAILEQIKNILLLNETNNLSAKDKLKLAKQQFSNMRKGKK